ncbi:hypothetical protein [Nocardia amikacinitolerans]|uniref:hypothetical protein n=1 Tax=Nocardia amikacinitolerans TaxID=756689 RepID=UPI0020A499F3|nr:hypothetical protein [Nocardia amikacinitolerans]MCP2279491.1 hypothetical protein [Nocardia amikacinitolerans]
MPEAGRRSRPMVIASMLPLAVLLGTGVANASPDATAQIPAAPPTHHEHGRDPVPSQSLIVLLTQPTATDRGDIGAANPLADTRTRIETIAAPDVPPAVNQEQLQALCAQIPVDPQRCTVATVDAGVGAAIGAGIAAGLSAPVAVAAAMAGAAAGFIVGIPFLPTGLVVGPLLGAAVGATVVAVPAAVLGGALGASIGALVGITKPLPHEGNRTEESDAPTTSPSNADLTPVAR